MLATLGRLAIPLIHLMGLAGTAYVAMTQILARSGSFGSDRRALAGAIAAGAVTVAGSALMFPPGARTGVFHQVDRSAVAHEFGMLLVTSLQLAMVVLLLRDFNIEHEAFYGTVAPLVLFGFLTHHGLAPRFRLPFFVLLSVLTFAAVLGIRGAVALLAIGLVVIALCHLPAPVWARTLLLLAAACLFAAARVRTVNLPVPAAVWPLVGSFFMFRTVSYFHELRHAKAPVGIWNTLAYFFLLPNVTFLLFPIVDFATMRRTYYGRNPFDIYQKGLRWLLRGVIYLLLYRYVYRYVVIAPSEVANASDLARHLVSNFLLLLQVLATFDLSVGILHFFGFDLPETNNLNLFSSGFADFWRRTNTYWRDFVMKVVYYPTFFRLRGMKTINAVLTATAVAFVATTLLHSYQWFWLLGTARLSQTDLLFWSIFGVGLMANVILESRKPKRATLSKKVATPSETATLVLKRVGMFAVVTLLWSLWTAPSAAEWWAMLRYAGTVSGMEFAWAADVAVVLALYWVTFRICAVADAAPAPSRMQPRARWLVPASAIILLFVLADPAAYGRFGIDAADTVRGLKTSGFNRIDNQQIVRSYYEDLTQANVTNPSLWSVFQPEKVTVVRDWMDALGTPVSDLRRIEMLPNSRFDRGYCVVTTNRWSMRDRDYEQHKPPDTYRAAFLGASYVVGPNVSDGENFESLVEDHLNRENDGRSYARYEILNFAVGSTGPLEALVRFEKKAVPFAPDAVCYISVEGDLRRASECLARGAILGADLGHDFLKDLATRARIDSTLSEQEAMRRLRPFQVELLSWVYRRLVEDARAIGAVPVWVGLPPINLERLKSDDALAARLAVEAGFVILNLEGVYDGIDRSTIAVPDESFHPNQLGCRVIADRLYKEMNAYRSELRLTTR